MTVIMVSGIPFRWTLANVVVVLGKAVQESFEALNFTQTKGGKGMKPKECYLRLHKKVDPSLVIDKINRHNFKGVGKLFACRVHKMPDLPISNKPKKMPQKMRRALKLPEHLSVSEVLIWTHREIISEMQLKYRGLNQLSLKTSHELLNSISQVISQRLKDIVIANPEQAETCFLLSKSYRRKHPHFGDFQMILSTLHRIQDAKGAAREQIVEADLINMDQAGFSIGDVPYDGVMSLSAKYSNKIITKVTDHIKQLSTNIDPNDSEEEKARKKVRQHLKKLSPHINTIVRQIVMKSFVPRENKFQKMRIYGEPILPPRAVMFPFVKSLAADHVVRSDRMYNLIKFTVSLQNYNKALAQDGALIGTSKMIIRSSNDLNSSFKIPPNVSDVKALLSGKNATKHVPQTTNHQEQEDEDWTEEW